MHGPLYKPRYFLPARLLICYALPCVCGAEVSHPRAVSNLLCFWPDFGVPKCVIAALLCFWLIWSCANTLARGICNTNSLLQAAARAAGRRQQRTAGWRAAPCLWVAARLQHLTRQLLLRYCKTCLKVWLGGKNAVLNYAEPKLWGWPAQYIACHEENRKV